MTSGSPQPRFAHGLGVATRNTTHFPRIDGLRVVTTTA